MNRQTSPVLEATSYDRANCSVGIVHIGYGAFHRAHQAVYVDTYMESTGETHWGIAAVNLRGSESASFASAAAADEGYLLKTTSPSGDLRFQLIRPHIAFEDWAINVAGAEAVLDSDSVHAVTITVTESGYYVNDDWSLNTTDPAIVSEVEGNTPTTVYGYLANALTLRAAGSGNPITILCCDNIRSNGKMLKNNFLQYLELRNLTDLAKWVRVNATFPCSMVDRITPRTSDQLLNEVRDLFPGRNLSPINGESFSQWVLENNFAGPMPDLAKAGVQVVEDVDPYEEAKIRVLNGGHTGLCYLGALAGHQTFDQAMFDDRIRPHFEGWETENVLPGLNIDLPFDRNEYLAEVTSRFCNAAIADDLSRICMDGWSKMPIFVRPTLAGCLEQGISPSFGYDCLASWVVFARRFAAGTMPVAYVDPYWKELRYLIEKGNEIEFASNRQLWADLPETHDEFIPKVVAAIEKMDATWNL